MTNVVALIRNKCQNKLDERHETAVNALLDAADEGELVGAEKLIVKAEYRKPWSGISVSLIIALVAVFLATIATKSAVISIPDSAVTLEFVQGIGRYPLLAALAVGLFILFSAWRDMSTRAWHAAAEVCRYRGNNRLSAAMRKQSSTAK